MSKWIREQQTTKIATASTLGERIFPPKKPSEPTGSASNRRSQSSWDTRQTLLRKHFPAQQAKNAADMSPSVAQSRLDREDGEEFEYPGSSTGNGSQKRKSIFSDGLELSSLRKAKKRRAVIEDAELNATQAKTAPDRNVAVFGLPPPSSLAARRGPKSLKKLVTSSGGPAPAISPSRRKSIISETLKEVAVQQHRQWQRSSSPLLPVENVVGRRQCSSRERETLNKCTTPTRLTPSKLRHGYSMLILDEDLYGDLAETCEGPKADEEDNDPPSPSLERQMRAETGLSLSFSRSPHSRKRIYAAETLVVPSSPSQRRAQSVEVASLESCVGESLPSPALQSTEADVAPLSSQTAAGGSFHLEEQDAVAASDHHVICLVSYKDQEDDADMVKPQDLGDETYMLPSSQDMDTCTADSPKETDRSTSESFRAGRRPFAEAERRGGAATANRKETADDEAFDATLPLAWTSPSKGEHEASSLSASRSIAASWKDVSEVWSQLHQDGGRPTQPKRKQQQASLETFGFQRSCIERPHSQSKNCNEILSLERGIDFNSSDEEVESDFEDRDEQLQHQQHQHLLWQHFPSEATQPLTWSDDDEKEDDEQHQEGFSSSPLLAMIPSEDDLDTQTRRFLEQI